MLNIWVTSCRECPFFVDSVIPANCQATKDKTKASLEDEDLDKIPDKCPLPASVQAR